MLNATHEIHPFFRPGFDGQAPEQAMLQALQADLNMECERLFNLRLLVLGGQDWVDEYFFNKSLAVLEDNQRDFVTRLTYLQSCGMPTSQLWRRLGEFEGMIMAYRQSMTLSEFALGSSISF